MKIFKGFSIKKFLLTILCSIIITTFVGFTYLFAIVAPSYVGTEALGYVDKNSEELKSFGYGMQDRYDMMKERFKEEKEKYGEDYPAEGLFIYGLTQALSSSGVCRTYSISLLTGIILGILIYIIFIQKATGVQMLTESLIFGIIIVLFVLGINMGYNLVISRLASGMGASNEQYSSYVYDIDGQNIVTMFIGTIGIAFIVNYVYQRILTNKFNKKLEK